MRDVGWVTVVLTLAASSLLGAQVSISPLLLCGGDEVFVVDAADQTTDGSVRKIWSWRAKDHQELPQELHANFGTTDDCKPIEGGTKILISSSTGGCALVGYPSGRVLWHARTPNAHSLELLPDDRIVVACSRIQGGDRLILFNIATSDRPLCDAPLPAAHGVVWDAVRQRLWALGYEQLQCYELKDWKTDKPSLRLQASYPLPDTQGHDLQAMPTGNDLVVSTLAHVYLFDREALAFRLHPDLGNRVDVKSISFQPTTGRPLYIHGGEGHWWSTNLHLLAPPQTITLPGERLYKARWLTESQKK